MTVAYQESVIQIARGHWSLALCAALYLVWWAIFFRPGAAATPPAVKGAGVACILGAFVTGLYAVFKVVGSQNGLSLPVPVVGIVALGIVAYFILLGVTQLALGRQVTTELALIVGWVVLEAIAIDVLVSTGTLQGAGAVVLAVIVGVAAVASLVCYANYYELAQPASFIDGCVPLAVVLAVSVAFALVAR